MAELIALASLPALLTGIALGWYLRRINSWCPRCGDTLHRVSYEDYEVTYCPSCQTKGKVLADRRLSRLIR